MRDEDEEHSPGSEPKAKVPVDVWLIPTASFTAGSILGFSRGARMSGLRFLAENAHRLPTTVGGWYFYNKTKNYRVLLGGFKGGVRQGLRFGAIGGCWVGVEQAWLWASKALGAPKSTELAKELIAGTVTAGTVSALCECDMLSHEFTVLRNPI